MDQTEYMYFVNIPPQQNTSSVETNSWVCVAYCIKLKSEGYLSFPQYKVK